MTSLGGALSLYLGISLGMIFELFELAGDFCYNILEF